MLSASGSTLIVKIDCFQEDPDDNSWASIGDAIFIFVARNKHTGKSHKVPKMKVSQFDSILDATESFELGHMIKHLSIKKANRDMKTFIPNYEESSEFQKYL